MKPSTRTRFPRPAVLGVLLFVAVLSACEASSCDLGPFPDNPFSNVSPGPRYADAADSGPIPTETTIPPGSEPLSGDAATLAAFYNATDGPNWSDNTNWLTDAPISDWSGVTASNIVNGGAVGECVVRRLYISFDRLSGEIPAELGNLPNLFLLFLQGNQLSGAIPIELGKIPSLSLDGNQLSGRIRRPNGTNPQYAWDGSTIRVSWDPVDGADYYKIYHDDFFDSSCSLTMGGSPSVCEELAANVVGTSYLHENPNASENYYWVVACNSDGCSEIDSRNPAAPIEPIDHHGIGVKGVLGVTSKGAFPWLELQHPVQGLSFVSRSLAEPFGCPPSGGRQHNPLAQGSQDQQHSTQDGRLAGPRSPRHHEHLPGHRTVDSLLLVIG